MLRQVIGPQAILCRHSAVLDVKIKRAADAAPAA